MFKSWRMSVHQNNPKKLQIARMRQFGPVLSMIFQISKITFTNFLSIFGSFFRLGTGRVKLPCLGLHGPSNPPKGQPPSVRALPPPEVSGQRGTHRYRVLRWNPSDQAAAVAHAMPAALVFSWLWPCDVRLSASCRLC